MYCIGFGFILYDYTECGENKKTPAEPGIGSAGVF